MATISSSITAFTQFQARNERSCVPKGLKLTGFETRKKRGFAVIRAASRTEAPDQAPATTGPKLESHLSLLERLTENSTTSQGGDGVTIRDQLASQVDEPEAAEVVVPLGKEPELQYSDLTISQKRNIRRQNYLNKTTERNDAPFFAAVLGFVLVPPIVILGYAIVTGYVEFFP
jgi:hypothetical protein